MFRSSAPIREASTDRRLILFPIFFDARKTVAQGRRVPKAAACEAPALQDLAECLSTLGLPWEHQAKAYCRDALTQRSRLRVALSGEDGALLNPAVPTRALPARWCWLGLTWCAGKALYKALSLLLQQHATRQKRAAAPGPAAVAGAGPAAPVATGNAKKRRAKK